MNTLPLLAAIAAGLIVAACGSETEVVEGSSSSGEPAAAAPVVATPPAQIPPRGHADLQSWLKAGAYKGWSAEPEVHAARSPSPHGFNRIYSNDGIARNVEGGGNWPVGAAAVKELYSSAAGTTLLGYAVYIKTQAESADGANWYWYETVAPDSDVPHDSDGVVADGLGGSGAPKSICVACHAGAGSDAAHTPSAGGRDQVYTPVP